MSSQGRNRGGRAGGRRGSPSRGRGGGSHRGPAPNSDDRRQGSRSVKRGLGGDHIEGRQAVRELLLAGRRKVREVVMSAELEPAPILDDIVELAASRRIPVNEVGRSKFDALTLTDASQGVLARAAPLVETELTELISPPNGATPLLVVVDGVTDPGNLGALLRSVEGAGATGVILPRHRAVHISPTATKTAAGAIEYLPMTLVGGLPAALAELAAAHVWIVGLDGDAEESIHDLRVADEPVALVLGSEGAGLSRLVRQRCDVIASIPMRGRLNSLNVGAAGAIACFELARLRHGSPS